MNPVAQNVASLIEPVLESLGYELIGVEYGDQGRGLVLKIYIDHPDGIKLEDCTLASRRVSALLDVEDLISGHYDLEMSSPGMDRPLFTEAHFERYVSKRVKIVMAVPQMGRRRFTGTLRNISEGIVEIEVDNEIFDLRFAQIASARLVPDS